MCAPAFEQLFEFLSKRESGEEGLIIPLTFGAERVTKPFPGLEKSTEINMGRKRNTPHRRAPLHRDMFHQPSAFCKNPVSLDLSPQCSPGFLQGTGGITQDHLQPEQ